MFVLLLVIGYFWIYPRLCKMEKRSDWRGEGRKKKRRTEKELIKFDSIKIGFCLACVIRGTRV